MDNGITALIISDPSPIELEEKENDCKRSSVISNNISIGSDENEEEEDEEDDDSGSEEEEDSSNGGHKEKLAACSVCVDVG